MGEVTGLRPIVGDLWRKNGATIRVNKISDDEVWVTWEAGELWDYRKVPLAVWDRDIVGAERIGRREKAYFLEFPEESATV